MDKIYIVMDYIEHDLKALMETMKESFSIGLFNTIIAQNYTVQYSPDTECLQWVIAGAGTRSM